MSLTGKGARLSAFTLVEMLVSIAVLTLLVLLVTRVLNSAATITTLGHKHMDTDNQARPIFDRMAEDFRQMVKRTDVDAYIKHTTGDQAVNDQIAFFSNVPGYYPSSVSQSPVSLVAYRIGQDLTTPALYNKLQRMGNGLLWNGASTTNTPILFLPVPLASPVYSVPPSPTPYPKPTPAWPQAGNSSFDPDYEVIGPQVFRFEYYYELPSGAIWTTEIINTLQDVSAIVVVIAAIDPKSRVLVTDPQLVALGKKMLDFGTVFTPGNSNPKNTNIQYTLQSQWQDTINGASIAANVNPPLVPAAIPGIRVYQRTFYLNGLTQSP